MCQWLSLGFGQVTLRFVVRQVLVMVKVRVGLQEMNVSYCNFPKSDLKTFVCACACLCVCVSANEYIHPLK